MTIPKHRKRGRLTLEEFRRARADGLQIRQIPKHFGVSKNHIQFLSAMDQGAFNHITKETFQQMYLSGIPLTEIAAKLNVCKDYIGFLREHFEVGRLGQKFIHRKKTEKPLTQRQKEMVYGTLMGDATNMSPSSLKIKQSTKQREFALWKMTEIQEHVSINSLKEEKYFDKRYKKWYEHIVFYTHANTDIETIITKFYCSGVKRVTQEILDHLTALSVAVWFMDDGTTDHMERSMYNANPCCKLCTDSFTRPEIDLICSWFTNKWGIEAYPQKRDERWRVAFSTTETPKLFDLIRPHIIPSMLYKLGGI